MKDSTVARVVAETQPLYGAEARVYSEKDGWWSRARAVSTVKLRFLGTHPRWAGSRVLQLQCESGLVADGLLRRGCDVVAVDTREIMVAQAEERSAAHGYRIDYRTVVDLTHLPFLDGEFDIVVCDHVFDRGGELAPLLAEVHRVLRPHGTLMFACMKPGILASLRRAFVPGRHAAGLPRQMERFKPVGPNRLRRAVSGAGFRAGAFAGVTARGWPFRREPEYVVTRSLQPLWIGTAVKG